MRLPTFGLRANGVSQKIKDLLCPVTKTTVADIAASEKELDGFVFHLTKVPAGHTRNSMIDMYYSVTEWAQENPGSGKRPILNTTENAQTDLLDDCFFYPESPESYESFRHMFETANTVRLAEIHSEMAPLVPRQLQGEQSDEEKKRGSLVDVLEDEATTDIHSQDVPSIHPDLTSVDSSSFLPILRTQDVTLSIPRALKAPSSPRKPQHPPAVPERVSSRQQDATQGASRSVGAGLGTVGLSRTIPNGSANNHALPEQLRIARIEANARGIRRRPVPVKHNDSRRGDAEQNPQTSSEADELLRTLTTHKIVGKTLRQEELADLRHPKPPPEFLPYRNYQPYRAECHQPDNRVSGQHNQTPESKPPPSLPSIPNGKEPEKQTSELPYIPASQAFGKQGTLSRLQATTNEEKHQDAKKPRASVLQATPVKTTNANEQQKRQQSNVSAVRSKVQFFEAKTQQENPKTLTRPKQQPTTRTKTATTTTPRVEDHQFAWPRFSDRDFTDPARTYAAKWRTEKRERRRGMILDSAKFKLAG